MRKWGISFGESERIELERVILDEDRDGAFDFLRKVVYPKVKETEKPGVCFQNVEKSVDEVSRPVKKHKNLGSFSE